MMGYSMCAKSAKLCIPMSEDVNCHLCFTDGGTRDELSTNRPTPVSKLSRASKKETPRAKFGRFVVKYGEYKTEVM